MTNPKAAKPVTDPKAQPELGYQALIDFCTEQFLASQADSGLNLGFTCKSFFILSAFIMKKQGIANF